MLPFISELTPEESEIFFDHFIALFKVSSDSEEDKTKMKLEIIHGLAMKKCEEEEEK